jgi:hypothetical protein
MLNYNKKKVMLWNDNVEGKMFLKKHWMVTPETYSIMLGVVAGILGAIITRRSEGKELVERGLW